MRARPGCPFCDGSGEIHFVECPVRLVTPDSWLAHDLYGHYRNNQLPASGGMLDQGAACLASLRVIDSCYGMYQELERMESEKRKAEGRPRGRR